jgi:hypothetical protein
MIAGVLTISQEFGQKEFSVNWSGIIGKRAVFLDRDEILNIGV